ncbi:MAG TPA: phage protein Gp36 family protein [Polyangiales bacterium]|nr:phage protein Gp36 family protein [Polyangiales bacterium]
MPAYVTQLEVERAIGEKTLRAIADDDKDGVADLDVVNGAILEASSIADSYIQDSLPLDVVSEALKSAVIAILVQKIRLPRDRTTEDSRRAYDAAILWLRDVSSGKAALGPKPVEGVYDADAPEVDTQDRIWDRAIASRVL